MVTQPLKGFRDLDPKQAWYRQVIETQIHKVGRQYGYLNLDTPCLEYATTLLGTGFADTDKEVYVFKDHGGRDVALRFDLTVSLARYVAAQGEGLNLPFKRYQIGKVWRGEKPQKGRFREFVQADFDVLGSTSFWTDRDVIAALMRAIRLSLQELGVAAPLKLRLSHRKIVNACLEKFLGLTSAPEHLGGRTACLIALDKLTKQGPNRVRALLAEVVKDTDAIDQLLKFLLDQSLQEQWSAFSQDAAWGELIGSSAVDLMQLQQDLRLEGVEATVDLSLVRGLAYYTGCVFEAEIGGCEDMGSISSGGRYDDLVGRFRSSSVTGVGGSVGVDRLLAVVEKWLEGREQGPAPQHDVGFVSAEADPSPDFASFLFQTGEALRNEGFTVISCVEPGKKLGQQFKRLERVHCAYALILGQTEQKNGTFNVKNMNTKQQSVVSSLNELCNILRSGSS